MALRSLASIAVQGPNGSASTAVPLPTKTVLDGGAAASGPDYTRGNAIEFERMYRITNITLSNTLMVKLGTTSAVAADATSTPVNPNNPVIFTVNPQIGFISVFGQGGIVNGVVELVTGRNE